METTRFLDKFAAEYSSFLDNANDMDNFRNSVDRYIPQKGWVLLTTRHHFKRPIAFSCPASRSGLVYNLRFRSCPLLLS